MKRTQIYLEEAQDAELGRRAVAERRTKSDLIRDAIDAYLGRASLSREEWRERWVAAVEATAGIAPHLPAGAEYVKGLRRAGAERQRLLDEHWRR